MWLHVFGRLEAGRVAGAGGCGGQRDFPRRPGIVLRHAGVGGAAARVARSAAAGSGRARGGASSKRREFSQSLTALLAACRRAAADRVRESGQPAARARRGAPAGDRLAPVARREPRTARAPARHREPGAGRASAAWPPIAVAYVLHGALVRMLAESDPRFHMSFSVDPLVLGFVVAATLGAALLFGVLPAWQVTRADAGRDAQGTESRRHRHARPAPLGPAAGEPATRAVPAAARRRRPAGADGLQPATRGSRLFRRTRAAGAGRLARGRRRAGAARPACLRELRGADSGDSRRAGGELFAAGRVQRRGVLERRSRSKGTRRRVTRTAIRPSTRSAPATSRRWACACRLGREIAESDHGDSDDRLRDQRSVREAVLRPARIPSACALRRVAEDGGTACQVVGVARNARTSSLRGDVEPRFFVAALQPPASSTSPTFLIRTDHGSRAGAGGREAGRSRASAAERADHVRHLDRGGDGAVDGAGPHDRAARRGVRRRRAHARGHRPVRRAVVRRRAAHRRDRDPHRAGRPVRAA